MKLGSLRAGGTAARCGKCSWVGLGLALALVGILMPSVSKAAANQFRLDGWANAQALLLAPETRPNWTVDHPADVSGFSVSIEKDEPERARIRIRIQASPNSQDLLVGRGDHYVFAPPGAATVLQFPVYILAPAGAQQNCALRISGPPQQRAWRFADKVGFSLQCDEKNLAKYNPEATGAGLAPLAKRLTSRWILDPDGSNGYALLLVQDTVKAALQDDLRADRNPQRKPNEIMVCAHQDVLDNATQALCDPLLLAALLSQPHVTAKHLAPRISKRLERSVFEDFALPFVERGRGVRLIAVTRRNPNREIPVAITLHPSIDAVVSNVAEAPSPAARQQTPPSDPPPPPTRHELRIYITNARDVCPQGRCPIKVAGKPLAVSNLEQIIEVAKTVDIQFVDDWTATKAILFPAGKNKANDVDITKFVDKGGLKLSSHTAPYGEPGTYELSLTLEKREKTIRWSVDYDPPPQRFASLPPPATSREITSVRRDIPVLVKDIPSSQYYAHYRLVGIPGPSPSLLLSKEGQITLPYPPIGKDMAEYKIVLSPSTIPDARLQALRFQFSLSFGRHRYALTSGCQAEIFLPRDPSVRFKLKAAANDRFSLTSAAANVKPIVYMPDHFTLELKDASCDGFPGGARFEIGRPFDQDPSAPVEIPLSIESQAYVAYVAGIEGNDSRYLYRLATYLAFVDDIYRTGYSRDGRSTNAWIYGTIFGQSTRENFIPLQQPRFPTGPLLINPNDLEKLAQQAYQARQAPEPFDGIAEKLLDLMTSDRNPGVTAWTLVYVDESFSFSRRCDAYNTPIEKLKSRGLKRALIVAVADLDGGDPLRSEVDIRRCNLDPSGQFRVYSLSRNKVADMSKYPVLDRIKENIRDWIPKKPGD